ncbi:MAG: GTP-binding protein [bacterium]|jgi:GTP-binding protein
MKSTIIAVVGRPNVGKSTLFNRFARKRIAIVNDQPGVTRDRNMSFIDFKGYQFTLIDTGGFEPDTVEEIPKQMREQSQLAVEEADGIIFVLDRTQGWSYQDRDILHFLRKSKKPVYFAVNKVDEYHHEKDLAEFYESGVENIYPVSGSHGYGVMDLLEAIAVDFPNITEAEVKEESEMLSVAMVGRPNAGKSSIVNCFLGEERHIVHDEPGTTRDPIDSYITHKGRNFCLIDTAGIRKKSRVSYVVDKYSMIASLKSIEKSDVVLLMIDATEPAVEQDARIAGYIIERGRALIIVVNKWDLVKKKKGTLDTMKQDIRDRLKFLTFAPIIFVSAKTGKKVPEVLDLVEKTYVQFTKRVQTSDLNKIVESMVLRHGPPRKGGKATKFYYASQVTIKPPTFVITTNNPAAINSSYHNYVVGQFRHYFDFEGTPLKIIWKKKDSNRGKP